VSGPGGEWGVHPPPTSHVALPLALSRRRRRLSGVFGVLQKSQLLADPLALLLDLLLHQVEAHRQQRQAERQPERAEHQLLARCPLVHVGAGHDVAEADRRQRDEAEVRPGEVVPVLPEREQHRSGEDVAADDHQADGDRDGDLLGGQVVVGVARFQLVVERVEVEVVGVEQRREGGGDGVAADGAVGRVQTRHGLVPVVVEVVARGGHVRVEGRLRPREGPPTADPRRRRLGVADDARSLQVHPSPNVTLHYNYEIYSA